jgi:hypothetical protein
MSADNKEYTFCFGGKPRSEETAKWIVEKLQEIDVMARYEVVNDIYYVTVDKIGKEMIDEAIKYSREKLASMISNGEVNIYDIF